MSYELPFDSGCAVGLAGCGAETLRQLHTGIGGAVAFAPRLFTENRRLVFGQSFPLAYFILNFFFKKDLTIPTH